MDVILRYRGCVREGVCPNKYLWDCWHRDAHMLHVPATHGPAWGTQVISHLNKAFEYIYWVSFTVAITCVPHARLCLANIGVHTCYMNPHACSSIDVYWDTHLQPQGCQFWDIGAVSVKPLVLIDLYGTAGMGMHRCCRCQQNMVLHGACK